MARGAWARLVFETKDGAEELHFSCGAGAAAPGYLHRQGNIRPANERTRERARRRRREWVERRKAAGGAGAGAAGARVRAAGAGAGGAGALQAAAAAAEKAAAEKAATASATAADAVATAADAAAKAAATARGGSREETSASAATAALRGRSKIAATERRLSARAAAQARRRAPGGSGSDNGPPEQLRRPESEVAELDVSEVFNPEDLRRDPEPETPGSAGRATEERTEEWREEKECEEGAKLKPFSFKDPPSTRPCPVVAGNFKFKFK